MVADDDENIRPLCRITLEAADVGVGEAADGDEAIARALPPDVALIDVRMAMLDGWGLAARLKARMGP